MDNKPYPIIGMSPGNSYFKDVEIRHLLKETVGRFGRTCIFIADVPAISTYVAYGYKMANMTKIDLSFEFSVLTLTVPGLRLRKAQNTSCF